MRGACEGTSMSNPFMLRAWEEAVSLSGLGWGGGGMRSEFETGSKNLAHLYI